MGDRVKYQYNSPADYLISNPLSVDGQLDDAGGATIAVKGREIRAAILFADISSFSRKTLELSSTETLIFINTFFTWITAEALKGTHGIVDKYIGDEIMVVFSDEFGSEDPFLEALQTARWIAEKDLHQFCPHVGIAAGIVTVGFVGTPLRYNCSVFGQPVTLAKKCSSIEADKSSYSSIFFPADLWGDRSFNIVFPPPHSWELLPPRKARLKNIGTIEVVEIAKRPVYLQDISEAERVREDLHRLREAGLYKPREWNDA